MKNKIISLLLFSIIGFKVLSNDYILKINLGVNSIHCNNVTIINERVSCISSKDSNKIELSVDNIYGINFYDDKPDELLLFSLQLDTIKCIIDSISKNKIFYREENNLLSSVNKNDVFCVQFGEISDDPTLNSFKNIFFQMHKDTYMKNPKLINKDGSKIDIVKVISLNKDKIEIQMVSRGVKINTFANLKNIKAFINIEPLDKRNVKFYKNYLLSEEGRIQEVNINKMLSETIEIGIVMNERLIKLKQDKSALTGLLFYDYKTHEKQKIIQSNNNFQDADKINTKIDFNVGLGYLTAKAPENATSEQEKYINEMRLALSIDGNINIFVTNTFGIGFKFNQYTTSNSILNVCEDNIKILFLGGTLLGNIPLPNNSGFYYSSISIGSLSETNNAKALGEDYKIEGSTIGLYLSMGIDFLVSKNIGIGFHCGVMNGKIKDFEINGQDEELDEPENLSRIDGMLGLKIYF